MATTLPPGQKRMAVAGARAGLKSVGVNPTGLPPGQRRMKIASDAAQVALDARNAAVTVPNRNAPPGIGAAESIARAEEARRKAAARAAATGGSSEAPPVGGRGVDPNAAPGGAPTAADIIGNYNLARAKILQGMAPQVAGFYDQARQGLTDTVGGLSKDLQDRLYGVGTDTASKLTSNLNGIDIGAGVAEAYNPAKTADAAYALGAAFPGESLAKQGAAFGSAAAFAPEAALTEGQYAIMAQLSADKKAELLANKDSGKVNPSVSKTLGFVADAYGNPLVGKDGKPIPIASAPLTDYQRASLNLQGQKFDYQRYQTDRAYQRSIDRDHVSDKKWALGFDFQNEKAAKSFKLQNAKFERSGNGVDGVTSKAVGYIVLKNGNIPKDKQGNPLALAQSPSQAIATDKQTTKMDDMVGLWQQGGKLVTKGSHTVVAPDGSRKTVKDYAASGKPMSYQVALRKLMNQYGLSMPKALELLDGHYDRGMQGRPLVSVLEQREFAKPKYVKWGITPALVKLARRSATGVDSLNAAHTIQGILAQHGIDWANEPNVMS